MFAVHLFAPCPPLRSIRHQRVDESTHELLGRVTEQFGHAAADAEDAAVGADGEVCAGRVLIQIAIAYLALPHALVSPHPTPLRTGDGGGDLDHGAFLGA